MIQVDHRNPLHDGLCRCSGCKPSPLAELGRVTRRLEVAVLAALVAGALAFVVNS